MVNKGGDDTSSSEDEISKDALKEATDHDFLKNTFFSTKENVISETSNKCDNETDVRSINDLTNLKSLRRNSEEKNKFANFGVSPSFQKYVANKLDEIIEKSFQIKNRKRNSSVKNNNKSTNSSGIKLLSTSAVFLTTEEEHSELPNPQRKRRIETTLDDKEKLLKCTEVAVDPEWILSKQETKAWTSKRKEPEFKYKRQKNGILLEITEG